MMNPLGIAIGALGTGIPDGTATPLLTIGLTTGDIVAGLTALAVATLGVLVVRRLQAPSDVAPNPATSPAPRGDELRRAA